MALKYVSTVTDSDPVLIGSRGQRFALQPDVPCYVAVGDSSVAVSSTNGILVAAGGLYEDVVEDDTNRYFGVDAVSGAHSVKFFRGT